MKGISSINHPAIGVPPFMVPARCDAARLPPAPAPLESRQISVADGEQHGVGRRYPALNKTKHGILWDFFYGTYIMGFDGDLMGLNGT